MFDFICCEWSFMWVVVVYICVVDLAEAIDANEVAGIFHQ